MRPHRGTSIPAKRLPRLEWTPVGQHFFSFFFYCSVPPLPHTTPGPHGTCVSQSVRFFGIADTVSIGLSVLLAPRIGAHTDKHGRRGYMLFFCSLAVLSHVCLFVFGFAKSGLIPEGIPDPLVVWGGGPVVVLGRGRSTTTTSVENGRQLSDNMLMSGGGGGGLRGTTAVASPASAAVFLKPRGEHLEELDLLSSSSGDHRSTVPEPVARRIRHVAEGPETFEG